MPLPAMIFQPLVENAMNHGMEPKMGEVSLVVRVELEKDVDGGEYLLARVEDNGVGMAGETLERLREIYADLEDRLEGVTIDR
jgi:two-component system sensor histidine kinase YesM